MSQLIQKFLANNAVSTAKIVDEAVTTGKIDALAVTEAKIAANAVTTDKVADGAITLFKLAANSVDDVRLEDNAVSTPKIQDLAVTNAKLADGIDVVKLSDGTIDNTTFSYLNGVTGPIQTQLNNKIDASEKGAADGVATLDSGGKIPVSQLPNTVMEYQGAWNASTNSPTLADGTGNAGDVYRVSTAGTQNLGSGSITFAVGDLVIYNGTIWERSPIGAMLSANEKETFVLAAGDITNGYIDLANVAETDSVVFAVRGAPVLFEGASYDYTINYTGGAGGNTRITWLNDLAASGASELIAGDVVQVQYRY